MTFYRQIGGRLTPGGQQQQQSLPLAANVKNLHDVENELDTFSEHDEERREKEVVK